MGAIQNSINMAGASVAGAAIGIGREMDKQHTLQRESFDESIKVNAESKNIAREADENNKAIGEARANKLAAEIAYEKKLDETEAFINEKHSRHTEGEKKGQFMSKADKAQELVKRRHDIEKLKTAQDEAQKNWKAMYKQRSDIKARLDLIMSREAYNSKKYEKYGYNSNSGKYNEFSKMVIDETALHKEAK